METSPTTTTTGYTNLDHQNHGISQRNDVGINQTTHDPTTPLYKIRVYSGSLAQLGRCCGRRPKDSIPFYKGGAPEDLPEGIDLWLWGGLSLLTDEIVAFRLRRLHRVFATLSSLAFFAFIRVPDYLVPIMLFTLIFLLFLNFFPVNVIFPCTMFWIHAELYKLVETQLNPKFCQVGYRIEYVVESSWDKKSYYAVYRASSFNNGTSAEASGVNWPPPSERAPARHPIESIEIFRVLANTRMHPELRYHVAQTIGLWSWGGMLEVVRKQVEPEREQFYNTIVSVYTAALYGVVVLFVSYATDRTGGWFAIHIVALHYCLLEPELFRWMDRRFGKRVQDAVLEVGPEFHRRTHYELEYAGRNVWNDWKSRPVILLVPRFPEGASADDPVPQQEGRIV